MTQLNCKKLVVNASKAQGTATAGNFTLIHRFVAHSSMQVRKHLKGTRPQCDNNCSTLKKINTKVPNRKPVMEGSENIHNGQERQIRVGGCTNLEATLSQLSSGWMQIKPSIQLSHSRSTMNRQWTPKLLKRQTITNSLHFL